MYQIQTERLLLQEIQEKDADIIVKWRADPQVYKYFRNPHMLTVEEHMEWFENVYKKQNNLVSWLSTAREVPVGVFGIKKRGGMAEVGYITAPESRGKGYAEEAMAEIMKWICKNWNIKIIVAEIHRDNESSNKFIKKMGFSQRRVVDDFIMYEKMAENVLNMHGGDCK